MSTRPPLSRSRLFQISIENCFYNLLLGVWLSSLLYCISVMQVSGYLRRRKKDGRLLKTFASLVWVIDTVHQVFIIYTIYVFSAIQLERRGTEFFTTYIWSIPAISMSVTTTFILVNSFLTWKIWKLSKNVFLITAITVILLAGAGLSTLWNLKALHLNPYKLLKYQNLARASVAITAISDFLIAISLNYYIDAEKSIPEALRITFRKARTAPGSSSFVVTLLFLFSDFVNQPTLYFVIFDFVLGKRHCISLFSSIGRQRDENKTTDSNGNEKTSVRNFSDVPTEHTPLLG